MFILKSIFGCRRVEDYVGMIYVCDLEKLGGHFYEEKTVSRKLISVVKSGTLELDEIKIHGEVEKTKFSPAGIISLNDYASDEKEEEKKYLYSEKWINHFYEKVEANINGIFETIKMRLWVREMITVMRIITLAFLFRAVWLVMHCCRIKSKAYIGFLISFVIGQVLMTVTAYRAKNMK